MLPAPDIDVDPLAINFGSVLINSSSNTENVTVTNTGTANLDIGIITINDTQFTIGTGSNISGQTLTPGESANISLVFKPLSTGNQSGIMSIPSNDLDESTVNVTLSGYGTTQEYVDLMITKSDNPDPIAYGDDLIYTITVTNNGTATATGVNVTDMISPFLVYKSSSTTTGSINATSDNISGFLMWSVQWNIGDLAPGASASLDIVTTIRPEMLLIPLSGQTFDTIDNIATVSCNEVDTDPSNNTVSEDTAIIGTDLEITKTALQDQADFTDNFTWIITVKNNGPLAAENVTVIEPYSTNLTQILDMTTSTGSVSETMPQWIDAIVSGYNLTSIIPANSLTSLSSLGISVKYWNIGYLASNASANMTLTTRLNINPSLISPIVDNLDGIIRVMSLVGGDLWDNANIPLPNVAGVISTTMESDASNNYDIATTSITANLTLPEADLEITKSASPDPVAPDGTITYTVTVKNKGPEDATGVFVIDGWPENTFLSPITVNTTQGTANQSHPDWLVGLLDLADLVGMTGLSGLPSSLPFMPDLTGLADNVSIDQLLDQLGVELLYWDVGDLALGESANLTFSASVNASSTLAEQMGLVMNGAIVMGLVYDPVSGIPSNNMAMVTTTIEPEHVDLMITKSDNPDPIAYGDDLIYTITVTNNGTATATGVNVTDMISPFLVYKSSSTTTGSINATSDNISGFLMWSVQWNIGDLAPGASASLDIVTTIRPEMLLIPLSGQTFDTIDNIATVSCNEVDTDPSNNTVSEDTAIIGTDLEITKTALQDQADFTDNFTWIITVKNNGPLAAENVTVIEPYSTNLTQILDMTTSTGSVSETMPQWIDAIVSGYNLTSIIPANSLTSLSSLGISVKYWNIGYLASNASANMTLTTRLNINPSLISPIVDNLDGIIRVMSLVGGDLWDNANIPLPNVAGVISTTMESDASNNYDIATTSITANLTLPEADLEITKSASPDPVAPDGTITYTVTVKNKGPEDATGVFVIDGWPENTFLSPITVNTTQGTANQSHPDWLVGLLDLADLVGMTGLSGLPSSLPFMPDLTGLADNVSIDQLLDQLGVELLYWDVGDLALGESANLTFSASVNASSTLAEQMGLVMNGAIVMGLVYDPVSGIPSNNMAMVTTPLGTADLAIIKTDAPDPVGLSGNFTYTVSVTNNGPTIASGVEVIDNLPDNVTFRSANASQGAPSYSSGNVTLNAGDLEVGATVNMTIVTTAPEEEGIITNTATVTGLFPDPVPENNTTSENTTVSTHVFDLVITKTDSPDPVAVSENITYVVTVENRGPADAESVSISDTLPPDTTFQEAVPVPSGINGNVLTWEIGNLADGESVIIIIVVQAPATTGIINNTAEIIGEYPEVDYSNNTVTEPTTVANITDADLAIIKVDTPDPVEIGKELSYVLTVTNHGPGPASSVNVTDILPDGVTFLSAVPSQGTTDNVSNIVTWNIGDLLLGNSVNLTINVLSPTVPGMIVNTANVSGMENDPKEENNEASAFTQVTSPDIQVTPTSIDFGSVYLYSNSASMIITVSNQGNADLKIGNVSIDDNQFEIISNDMSGHTLTPGSSEAMSLRFSPAAYGTQTTAMYIPSNDPDENPLTVTLRGNGKVPPINTEPDIQITPTPIDFGSVCVNSTSSPVIVTVSNQGNANLIIGKVSISDSQFEIISDDISGYTLTPGNGETMSLRFSPAALGLQTATMQITSNDPDENPISVTLRGTVITCGSPDDTEEPEKPEQPAQPSSQFTVDFLGEITGGPVSEEGELLQDIVAMSPDQVHVIEIDKGTHAYSSNGTIVTYIKIREAETIPALPIDTVLVGKAYEFSPSGTVFDKTIRLTLGYDVDSLPSGITSLDAAYYTAEGGWTYLAGVTSGVAELGRVTAPVEHFTIFAVLAKVSELELTPAAFKLSNLSITPSERKFFTGVSYFIKTGETATISVDVTNEGQQEGVYSATLKVNDRDIETKQVALSPGETQTVSFTFKADERGHYYIQIGDLSGDLYNDLWINWWLWAGSIGVFLLLLWGIRKYLKSRRAD